VTTTDHDRAVSDPNGFITDLVVTVDDRLAPEQVRAIVTAITGGRAKSRRLAAFLADRPAVLSDGRSPAPRAVGDLLIALRAAGAAVSPPVCAACSKPMRTLQRRGQDWYCGACGVRPFPAPPAANCSTSRPGIGPGNPAARNAPTAMTAIRSVSSTM
jgi:hypothetical protein